MNHQDTKTPRKPVSDETAREVIDMEFEVPPWNRKNSLIKPWCLGALVVTEQLIGGKY